MAQTQTGRFFDGAQADLGLLGVNQIIDVGQATETDTAQTITSRKLKVIAETVIGDDFNRANNPAPGLGAGWSAPNWAIVDNRADRGSGGNGNAIFLTDTGEPNHWVEGTVVGTPGVSHSAYVVVIARSVVTPETNSVIGFIDPFDFSANIGAYQGGSFSNIGSNGVVDFDITGTYTLRLECTNGTARLYLDGVEVVSANIGSLTNLGTFGGWDNQSNQPPIDNFRIGYWTPASETDTSQTITPVRTRTVAVGLASESDTAQTITPVLSAAEIGQASETDSSQTISVRKTRTIGQVSEADTAQEITTRKTKAIAQSSETDSAQLVTARKTRTVTQASETDTSQAITRHKTKTVGQSSETDTAHGLIGDQTIAVGQASEADTAQPLTVHRTYTIAQAVESDSAQPVTGHKTKAISQTVETDIAIAVVAPHTRLILQAVENDSATSITLNRTVTVGQAVEVDSAQPLRQPIATAFEVDIAFGITVVRPFPGSVELELELLAPSLSLVVLG